MEIILLQDIVKLGYKNDVVKVRNGYANNYLIPQGFAIMATERALKVLEENKRQSAFKEEKVRKEADALANTLNALSVKVGAKTGSTGKIFGSVNAIQISEALKSQHNVEIDRKKITLDDIKELGTYKAYIHLHRDVKAEVTIEVVGE